MFFQKTRAIDILSLVVNLQSSEVARLSRELAKKDKENAGLTKQIEQLSKNFNQGEKNFNQIHHECTKATMQRDWLADVSEQKTKMIVNLKVEIALLKQKVVATKPTAEA